MRFGLGLDEINADNLLLADDDLRLLEGVNAGEKMHRRTEVIMHRDGPPAGAPLSSSIDQPAFPVPTWHHLSHGAQRRGWEERSHAQQREHGEHRTFLAVSTVAG